MRSARDKARAHARAARRHAAFGNAAKARAHWRLALEYRALAFGAPSCGICGLSEPPPIPRGCACQGVVAHIDCVVRDAKKREAEDGSAWWQCRACKQALTGKMQQALGRAFWDSARELHPRNPKRQVAAVVWARCHLAEGRYKEAEENAREALEGSSLQTPDAMVLSAHSTLAQALSGQGKHAEAEQVTRDALEAARRNENQAPYYAYYVAEATGDLASILGAQGKHAEAERESRKGIAMLRTREGDEHPKTLNHMGNLASLLMRQHKPADAEALYRAVLNARTRALGPKHPHTLASATNLGRALFELKRYDEAEILDRDALERALEIGEETPLTLTVSANLATTLGAQKKNREARRLFADVLARLERKYGSEHEVTLAYAKQHQSYLEAANAESPFVGAKATLHGLDAAGLNGREAIVLGPEGDQYVLELLDSKGQIRVKRANFRVRCMGPKCTTERDADNVCAGCRSAWYCCKECQKAHWREHKPVCKEKGREAPKKIEQK